jgi:hypothetical protein
MTISAVSLAVVVALFGVLIATPRILVARSMSHGVAASKAAEAARCAFDEPLIDYAAEVMDAFLSTPRGDDPNVDTKRTAVEVVIGRFPNGLARFNHGCIAAKTREALLRRKSPNGITEEQRATFGLVDGKPLTDAEILNSWLAVMSAWVILSG